MRDCVNDYRALSPRPFTFVVSALASLGVHLLDLLALKGQIIYSTVPQYYVYNVNGLCLVNTVCTYIRFVALFLFLFRLLTSPVSNHLRDPFLEAPGSPLREAISTQAATSLSA